MISKNLLALLLGSYPLVFAMQVCYPYQPIVMLKNGTVCVPRKDYFKVCAPESNPPCESSQDFIYNHSLLADAVKPIASIDAEGMPETIPTAQKLAEMEQRITVVEQKENAEVSKRATLGFKETLVGLKETFVGLKETFVGLKETIFGLKETVFGFKETVFGLKEAIAELRASILQQKETVMELKDTVTQLKATTVQQKEEFSRQNHSGDSIKETAAQAPNSQFAQKEKPSAKEESRQQQSESEQEGSKNAVTKSQKDQTNITPTRKGATGHAPNTNANQSRLPAVSQSPNNPKETNSPAISQPPMDPKRNTPPAASTNEDPKNEVPPQDAPATPPESEQQQSEKPSTKNQNEKAASGKAEPPQKKGEVTETPQTDNASGKPPADEEALKSQKKGKEDVPVPPPMDDIPDAPPMDKVPGTPQMDETPNPPVDSEAQKPQIDKQKTQSPPPSESSDSETSKKSVPVSKLPSKKTEQRKAIVHTSIVGENVGLLEGIKGYSNGTYKLKKVDDKLKKETPLNGETSLQKALETRLTENRQLIHDLNDEDDQGKQEDEDDDNDFGPDRNITPRLDSDSALKTKEKPSSLSADKKPVGAYTSKLDVSPEKSEKTTGQGQPSLPTGELKGDGAEKQQKSRGGKADIKSKHDNSSSQSPTQPGLKFLGMNINLHNQGFSEDPKQASEKEDDWDTK